MLFTWLQFFLLFVLARLAEFAFGVFIFACVEILYSAHVDRYQFSDTMMRGAAFGVVAGLIFYVSFGYLVVSSLCAIAWRRTKNPAPRSYAVVNALVFLGWGFVSLILFPLMAGRSLSVALKFLFEISFFHVVIVLIAGFNFASPFVLFEFFKRVLSRHKPAVHV